MVSVIIPTYNHRDYVLKTLDSVFAQTFTDYEILVINDGSPDDTDAVLRPLVDAGKIRYILQENAGQSAARNRGIAETCGEFVALLDDDDLWPPDKLEWQVKALQDNPEAAAVYGRVLAVNEEGGFFTPLNEQGKPMYWLSLGPTGDVHDAFAEDNYIVSPGQCLLRRSSLETLGKVPFNPKIRGGSDDWEFYLRLSRQFPFVCLDRPSLHYRLHESNASNNLPRMLFSILSVRRTMFETETEPIRREKWRQSYRQFARTIVLTSLMSFSEPYLKKQGWTPAIAMRCLTDLTSFVPVALKDYVQLRIGGLKRKLSAR